MITKKIRIQFVDTDASGRIHYSAIFRYFEIMDHDFFRRIGYSYKKIFQLGLDMPRVHVECSYLGEIGYDDELEAQVSIAKDWKFVLYIVICLFERKSACCKGKSYKRVY